MFSNSYLPFHIRNNRENRARGIKIHASFKGVGLKSCAGARSSHQAPAARNRNRLEAVVAHKGANPVGIFSRLGLSLGG